MVPEDVTRAQDHAVSETLALAGSLGLRNQTGVVLRRARNVIVRMMPSGLVAKIRFDADDGRDALEWEARVLGHLGHVGAPVPRLPAAVTPGPHPIERGHVLFLEFLDHGPGRHPRPRRAARAIDDVHRGLSSFDGPLPSVAVHFSRAERLLHDASLGPLPEADRAFMRAALEELLSCIRPGGDDVGLHGDPWLGGNVVATPGGAALLDFEAACRGPVEWDCSALPDRVVTRLALVPDPERLRIMRLMRSLVVSTWCWHRHGSSPENDEAARFHLDVLRSSSG